MMMMNGGCYIKMRNKNKVDKWKIKFQIIIKFIVNIINLDRILEIIWKKWKNILDDLILIYFI
jgi:hypothetical protein